MYSRPGASSKVGLDMGQAYVLIWPSIKDAAIQAPGRAFAELTLRQFVAVLRQASCVLDLVYSRTNRLASHRTVEFHHRSSLRTIPWLRQFPQVFFLLACF